MSARSPAENSGTAAERVAQLGRLADAFGGRLAVAARDELSGETFRFAADEPMPTASVIKLGVLVAVFAREAAGDLSLDRRVVLSAEERVGGSGIIMELSAGTALTVHDLATLMVIVSDNTATNLLIDLVGGVEWVNRVLHDELGLAATTLRRKLTFTDSDRGPLAFATPDDLVALVGGLLAGRVVSPRASQAMLDILARQQYLDQVPRLLDRRLLPEEPGEAGTDVPVAIACKTGMIDGVRAEAGVFTLRGVPVSYAVMTQSDAGDAGLDLDNAAQLVNAEVGRLLVGWFWPGPGDPPLAAHPAERWQALHAVASGPAA